MRDGLLETTHHICGIDELGRAPIATAARVVSIVGPERDAHARPGDAIVVHCTAGISRPTAALAILLARRHPGREDEIFARIRAIRPQAWPNSRVIAFGDDLLGLHGALTAALRRHYAVRVAADPWIGAEMRSYGRGSEVPSAT